MKIRYLLAASVVSLAATTAITTPAFAQQITSSVEGQVVDESGAPLSGATVVVTDTRTNASRTTVTGADGRFNAPNLTVGGPFSIAVNADGYEGQTVNDVITTLQGATSVTFSLVPGSGGIVVSGSRAQVSQLAVGPGSNFSFEVLQNAATFNRDIRDVIRVDPRVSLDRDDGGSGQDRISCLGGNDRGNAFTIDGISQGDIYGLNDTGFASRSSIPVPFDAVSQTQVEFAPFDVEYGAFTGCAINVVTRSGSNRFTGSAFFEYSDTDLRGTKVADRSTSPIEPEYHYGVALGGPIIRDKLFFFGAYEYQEGGVSQDDGPAGADFANELAGVSEDDFNEIREVLQDVYGVDTGDLVRSREFQNERYFARLDWQINDDHRLEGTYQRLEEFAVRADDFDTRSSSTQVTGRNTFYNSGTNSDYYSGRLFSNWTDNFSTELRYSRSEVQDVQNPIGGGEAQSENPIPRFIIGVDNATGPDGTVLAGPGGARSANSLFTTVEQYRALARLEAGNHTLKFGVELNQVDLFNLFVFNGTGTLVFSDVDDLRDGLLSPGTGNNQGSTSPSNVISGATEGAIINVTPSGDINDAAVNLSRSLYSAYVQDEWRMTDQLNAVLGLRVDWYDGNRPPLNENFLARYGYGNNTGFSDLDPVVLPRFALTYDMDDFAVFSRAQVRGGVGVFSGGDPLVWFGNAFQNNGRLFESNSQAAGCPTGQIDVTTGGTFTGIPDCVLENGQTQAERGLGDTQSIDPDIKIPTVLRANIGFQSELNFTDTGFFSGWNINLDYIYSRYQNPFTVVDLSQTIDTSRGDNGFTVDGRPILRAIDPTVAGCDAVLVSADPEPIYTGVTSACFSTSRDDELALTNSAGYRSHNASAILSKTFDGGIFTDGGSSFFSLGYAYTDAEDRRNLYNSTAGSNYDLTPAFNRNNPDASRGFYESRHNITFAGNISEQFFDDLNTSFGFTFIARSGRPYSLTFSGGGTFNDSASGNDNALLYVPTGVNDPNVSPLSNQGAVEDLVEFVSGLDCARDYAGQTIERNTCTNDWYYDLDLNFSQELPGPGSLFGVDDKIRVYGMFDNFLNFLDPNWNVHRRRNFAALQDVAGLTSPGVDSEGRYIIGSFIGEDAFDSDNQINVTSSVWRLKFGVSYAF